MHLLGEKRSPTSEKSNSSTVTLTAQFEATPLLACLVKTNTLTYYLDVDIVTAESQDAHLSTISELIRERLPAIEVHLKTRSLKEIYMEICIDYQAATSFRLPDIIPLDGFEKELKGLFRRAEMANRFLLKMSFLIIPNTVTYREVRKNSSKKGNCFTSAECHHALPERENSNKRLLAIRDCFKVTEKGKVVSSNHTKIVYDLQLTREKTLAPESNMSSWSMIFSDLLSDNLESAGKETRVSVQIHSDGSVVAVQPQEPTFFTKRQFEVAMKGRERIKKVTLKLIFCNGPYDQTDLDDWIHSYVGRCYVLSGFEEQLLALQQHYSVQVEEPKLSFISTSFSYDELSRESWGLHTSAKTYKISCQIPKTIPSILVDLARKNQGSMCEILGQELLVGYNLRDKSTKTDIRLQLVEVDTLNERTFLRAGPFKLRTEFEVQIYFLNFHKARSERLVDGNHKFQGRSVSISEVTRILRKETMDPNGNAMNGDDGVMGFKKKI